MNVLIYYPYKKSIEEVKEVKEVKEVSFTKVINHPAYGIIKCFLNDLVCNVISNGQIWEEHLYNDIFKKYVLNNTSILDCGSFIGSHTILINKLNRNNDIFCFEMMPEHYKVLLDNIKLNNLSNVFTFNNALGNKLGHLILPSVTYDNKSSNYGGISLNYSTQTGLSSIQITLDYILPFINKPISFIKMDIEGNEINCLYGAKQLITKYKPIMLIELWSDTYNKFIVDDIWVYFLQNLGYKINHISGDDYLFTI